MTDESISPAPLRGIGAGAWLVFTGGTAAITYDAENRVTCGGWHDFAGRAVSLDTAKLLALLAIVDRGGHPDDPDPFGDDLWLISVAVSWAHIVLGDRIVCRWDGAEWTSTPQGETS